jgi:outer membrane protein assembly factor BamB
MSPHLPRPGWRPGRVAALVTGLVLLLAACGSATSSSGSPAPSASGGAGTAAEPGAPAPGNPATGSLRVVAGASVRPSGSLFPNGLLIADRGNGRILAISSAGTVLWRFPARGSIPPGQRFSADDAFVDPGGTTIVANDEFHQVIDRIDIRTRRVVWQYGHYNVPGAGIGYLHNPDDAYPLANGDIVVADIVNCRVLQIAPDKNIVHMWGQSGHCSNRAPTSYGQPNGDTPLPDGGLLITEIRGSRVVRLSATGKVLLDIHVPVSYPSDAQLDSKGNIILVDYSNPGAVIAVTQKGRLLWRYAPTSGKGRMDHPSLGTPLPNGDIVINDDLRNRIIVLDPRTMKIVWQYGHTDVAGMAPGYLSDPDGHQPIPANAVF